MTDPLKQPPHEPIGPTVPVEAEPYREPEPIPASTLPESNRPAPGFNDKGKVKSTAVSGVWVGLIATAVFLILLVIFIAQNSRRVSLHFFGWHGQFSLALTILLSAVIGVLLVAVPGTVRILQLRRALRRNGPR
jgi:uncharacterized integral membrane protein